MSNNKDNLVSHYNEQGYFVIKNYFSATEIASLRQVILKFHSLWQENNKAFYQEEAFNSSLVTGTEYLASSERAQLFNFISSEKIMEIVDPLIPGNPAFMNTQLFFNPVNPEQKDFWHRDCQYDHAIEEQKRIIFETQVVHLRVPLFDELGIELIPGTHLRWDNDEELAIRHELNGRMSDEPLSNSQKIALSAGDLLVFSADMIHRGLYGLDRLALDILIFDAAADYIDYVDDDCLPDPALLEKINNPVIFSNTIKLKMQA